jgi:hypothetical protein
LGRHEWSHKESKTGDPGVGLLHVIREALARWCFLDPKRRLNESTERSREEGAM